MAENQSKSAYDWAELILGAGATITDKIFSSKEPKDEVIETQPTIQQTQYTDLATKAAIGVAGIAGVFLAYKLIMKL